VRFSRADVRIFDVEVEGGGDQVGLILGYGW
jgi:hypothetical protein